MTMDITAKIASAGHRGLVGSAILRLDPGQIEVMEPAMARVMRDKTPAQRLQVASALWESSRTLLLSHLAHTHRDWPPDRILLEVAHRMSHGTV